MQLEMQENNANSKFKKGQEIKSGGHQNFRMKDARILWAYKIRGSDSFRREYAQ